MSKSVYKLMDKLSDFTTWVDFPEFVRLFTSCGGDERMAEHLWSKFYGYDYDLVKLWRVLDSSNKRIVARMIVKWRRVR